MRRRPRPEGIRITKLGLWYVLLTFVVAVAATNTGNNALYMVAATMFAVLVTSGVVSRHNLRRLELIVEPPGEIFARSPFALRVRVANPGRRFTRRFLVLRIARRGRPLLVPRLPPSGVSAGLLELMIERRGRHRLGWLHFSSHFPFGLFRKGMRYPVDVELLVYPELYEAAGVDAEPSGEAGWSPAARPGQGQELHSLRDFRAGDDPRRVHWKQTARTGRRIVTVRESEEDRRLSIVLDNGIGETPNEAARERFEHLVSEAATAAVDHLEQGYEVELVTRDGVVPFGRGARQRLQVLETLALIAPVEVGAEPLGGSDPRVSAVRLGLTRELATA